MSTSIQRKTDAIFSNEWEIIEFEVGKGQQLSDKLCGSIMLNQVQPLDKRSYIDHTVLGIQYIAKLFQERLDSPTWKYPSFNHVSVITAYYCEGRIGNIAGLIVVDYTLAGGKAKLWRFDQGEVYKFCIPKDIELRSCIKNFAERFQYRFAKHTTGIHFVAGAVSPFYDHVYYRSSEAQLRELADMTAKAIVGEELQPGRQLCSGFALQLIQMGLVQRAAGINTSRSLTISAQELADKIFAEMKREGSALNSLVENSPFFAYDPLFVLPYQLYGAVEMENADPMLLNIPRLLS